ncbi:Txe/YoeB family addiction module toxin [Solimonas marina]|uniref:Putative mRNA interferase YoeB n=1 Tax=Solimonas marina TaxID=2714601 RepID=A0A970B5Y8_9GAMM|nr:Txe/YoeB family addiction module toxin [Solimonas marina]NKF22085.1 Txe/YoeB family addiction module toxin [Solimonas marina]
MNLVWTVEAWEDYLWHQQNNKPGLKRINTLIKDIRRNPFDGIGKPEPLKHHLSGYWSRRIDDAHRLVYSVEGNALNIVQCRYHY